MRESGAPVLVGGEAEIEYVDGIFYVTDAAGPRAFKRHVFMRNFRTAAKAIQDSYAAEGAEIIPFPEDVRAAH